MGDLSLEWENEKRRDHPMADECADTQLDPSLQCFGGEVVEVEADGDLDHRQGSDIGYS